MSNRDGSARPRSVRQYIGEGKLIANFGVGITILRSMHFKYRYEVTNTPGVLTDATAEINDVDSDECTTGRRGGKTSPAGGRCWRPTPHVVSQVTGKTLGIVGMSDWHQIGATGSSWFWYASAV